MTHLLPTHRSLRLAVVTETYPPEVNGVAVTVARLIEGLLLRGHEIDLVRPRQALRGPQGTAVEGLQELLMLGLPIPRYPQLRMGLPAKAALVSQWQRRRPDLVHVATEGPLGWSAVQAARKLRLPVSADFRTNFHAYQAVEKVLIEGIRDVDFVGASGSGSDWDGQSGLLAGHFARSGRTYPRAHA